MRWEEHSEDFKAEEKLEPKVTRNKADILGFPSRDRARSNDKCNMGFA